MKIQFIKNFFKARANREKRDHVLDVVDESSKGDIK